MSTGKGLIRSLSRKGTRTEKKPAGARRSRRPQEPTICERCGAVFARQTWRRDRPVTHACRLGHLPGLRTGARQ